MLERSVNACITFQTSRHTHDSCIIIITSRKLNNERERERERKEKASAGDSSLNRCRQEEEIYYMK